MVYDNGLAEKAARWIKGYFHRNNCTTCHFHNFQHTIETVTASKVIAERMLVSGDEFETIIIACWFHDIGFLIENSSEHHEEKSAKTAEIFLKKNGADKDKINSVKACILATKAPPKPNTLLEKIVCDADLSHLGMDNYLEKNALLRQEFEIKQGRRFSDTEWLAINRDFFHKHSYFTSYARGRYSNKKNLNLHALENLLESG